MAGCATSTGSAGHAPAGATANSKLTFHPDHSVGADHLTLNGRLEKRKWLTTFAPILISFSFRLVSDQSSHGEVQVKGLRFNR